MKFLITTAPRRLQVPPAALIEASKAWVGAKLADKTLDCCYGFITGGGVSICNAESADAMLSLLMSYPAYYGSDWKIEPLCGIDLAMDQIIAMIRKAGG